MAQQLFTKLDRQMLTKIGQQMLTKLGQQMLTKLCQQMLTKLGQQMLTKLDRQLFHTIETDGRQAGANQQMFLTYTIKTNGRPPHNRNRTPRNRRATDLCHA